MGGQACVFYGAAEFSRDTDLAILADAENLVRLRRALDDLQANAIAVPSCKLQFLRRGHAVHFRCQHPDAPRMRVDVMSKMRGVDVFSALWRRRTTIALPDGTRCDLMSLPDLVLAKKTQRDKDWPMIRRLVEANYFENYKKPNKSQIAFWLLEMRTPQLLIDIAKQHPAACKRAALKRPLLSLAVVGSTKDLQQALQSEETAEREIDQRYWSPLRKELEKLRHARS